MKPRERNLSGEKITFRAGDEPEQNLAGHSVTRQGVRASCDEE